MRWLLTTLVTLGLIVGAAGAAYRPLSKRKVRHMERDELIVKVLDLQRIIERQRQEIERLRHRLRFQRRGRCE